MIEPRQHCLNSKEIVNAMSGRIAAYNTTMNKRTIVSERAFTGVKMFRGPWICIEPGSVPETQPMHQSHAPSL
jgi:hypothetical protein